MTTSRFAVYLMSAALLALNAGCSGDSGEPDQTGQGSTTSPAQRGIVTPPQGADTDAGGGGSDDSCDRPGASHNFNCRGEDQPSTPPQMLPSYDGLGQ